MKPLITAAMATLLFAGASQAAPVNSSGFSAERPLVELVKGGRGHKNFGGFRGNNGRHLGWNRGRGNPHRGWR
jgi:hypothetical protein